MAIKSVLKEELQHSLRLKKRYEAELAKLPKGSLIKKNIKGHFYYYVVKRVRGEVKFEYKGKEVPQSIRQKYEQAKKLRAKYRHLLSKTKRQIKFLKGALRGREAI